LTAVTLVTVALEAEERSRTGSGPFESKMASIG